MNEQFVERQKDHFNSITGAYVAGRRDRNHIAVKNLIWREAVRDVEFDLPEKVKILEPMCGVGEGLDFFSAAIKADVEYEGFDYSDEIVARAKELRPDAKIWKADVTSVELPEANYDIVIILGGLHHVPFQVDTVMKKVSAALKPGGYFINFEPTSDNPAFAWVRNAVYARNKIFDEQTERGFSVQKLLTIMDSAGLAPERVIYPGLAAYVMYYNPYAFPLLNIGSPKTVERIFTLDRLFVGNRIGRLLSFATFSIWRRKR